MLGKWIEHFPGNENCPEFNSVNSYWGISDMDLKTLKKTPSWEWPDNADGFLIGVLGDENADPADRMIAAELAGEFSVAGDKMADALLSVIKSNHENERLRTKAVSSLGPGLEYADMMEFEDPDDIMISEKTFKKIQGTLRKLYMDAGVSAFLRRRILEASVRAPQTWHQNAVRVAYKSGVEEWKITAVFCMRYVKGFDKQILESVKDRNPEIECHAIYAAGNWELNDAWPYIVSLLSAYKTPKNLLLAAIEAAATIRPSEASPLLRDLLDSDDQDIVDTVYEAVHTAEAIGKNSFEEYDDEDFDKF